MAIDWSLFAFPKGAPRVVKKAKKAKAERKAWKDTKTAVDTRDKGTCFVTGKRLTAGAVDAWQALERNHLNPRSLDKQRRYVAENVLTVSRAVHQLIHSGALKLLNKRGLRATSVESIDHVAWNRLLVKKGEEPCRIRRGLAVREMTRD